MLPAYSRGHFFMVSQKIAIRMYEQFIELTNQIFW